MKSRPKKTEAAAVEAVGPTSAEKAPWSIKNLSHAWNDLLVAWRVETGFRNHVLRGLAMLTLLIFLRPEPMWWAAVAVRDRLQGGEAVAALADMRCCVLPF